MEFNGTFFVTIISFLVFVYLMNRILYSPILNIMSERRSFIDGNYRAARENDEKSDSLTQEREDRLIEAKGEARTRYVNTLNEYKTRKSELIENAHIDANKELENSRMELEKLSNDVKCGLKGSMTNLANDIVEKVIGYRSEVQGFDDEVVNRVLWENK